MSDEPLDVEKLSGHAPASIPFYND